MKHCGVNCAYVWLRMASIDVSYEECRERIGVGENGSSLLKIKDFLGSRSLHAEVVKGGPKLLSEIGYPSIAHFETDLNSTGHFVLVLGQLDDQIEFIDGMNATHHVIPTNDFLRHWSGYLLVRRVSTRSGMPWIVLAAVGGSALAWALLGRRVAWATLGCSLVSCALSAVGEASPARAESKSDRIADIIAERDRQVAELGNLRIEMESETRVPEASRQLVQRTLGIRSESSARITIAYDGRKRYFRAEQPETTKAFDGVGFRNGYLLNVPLIEHAYDGKVLTNLSGGGATKRLITVFDRVDQKAEEAWFPGGILDLGGTSHRNAFDGSMNKTNLGHRLSLGEFSVVEDPSEAGKVVLQSKTARIVVDPTIGYSLLEERRFDPNTGLLDFIVVNSDFVEVKPGCWLPKQSTKRLFRSLEVRGDGPEVQGGDVVTTVRVTRLEVDSCRDHDFEIEYEPGYLVMDETQRDPNDSSQPLMYEVPSPGQPANVKATTKASTAAGEVAPQAAPPQANGWTERAVPIAMIALGAGLLGLWAYRRTQRDRDARRAGHGAE